MYRERKGKTRVWNEVTSVAEEKMANRGLQLVLPPVTHPKDAGTWSCVAILVTQVLSPADVWPKRARSPQRHLAPKYDRTRTDGLAPRISMRNRCSLQLKKTISTTQSTCFNNIVPANCGPLSNETSSQVPRPISFRCHDAAPSGASWGRRRGCNLRSRPGQPLCRFVGCSGLPVAGPRRAHSRMLFRQR